jgi:ribosomal protein S18 acetylase RimI-like enzyme
MVADDGGQVAGYANCTYGFDLEFGGRDAFLTELIVAAPWRGRGIGPALLDALEAEARACDVHALHLLARTDNAPALAIYKARGYAIVPRHFLSKRLI